MTITIGAGIARTNPDNTLVYLSQSDEHLAVEIIAMLKSAGYDVQHFVNLSTFEQACGHQIPDAVIIDVADQKGQTAEAALIARMKSQQTHCPPVIFISENTHMDYRLAATRAGVNRLLSKPLNMNRLINILNGLTEKERPKPFRILLIDDDKISLKYYGSILSNAGMDVTTLSSPLEALDVLEDFRPDVMVTDLYMPECSGAELVQVIRQDDAWAMMPIIFLSTEADHNRQIEALNNGGDNFLTKPVEANFLVTMITAKAKRARWSKRLTNDLRSALRENRFHLATMDQHDIVSTADVTGRMTSVNDKFCEISGYNREELLGRNHRILKSDQHDQAFYDDLWATISQGKIWHGTICNRKKDGRDYWVKSTIVPFLDDRGRPYKYVSARTDVTRLRQSEERLKRSQDFANIGNWDWNISTGKLYWSDNIWPLFGYDKDNMETTYDNFLAAIHPDDRDWIVEAIHNCVEHGADYNVEHRVVWPDGSSHWVQQSGDVVRDKSGSPVNMLGVVHDIDKRKRAELNLIERERLLHEAQALSHMGNWQANLITGKRLWSDEIYRIIGHEPGSVEPSAGYFFRLIHPDDQEQISTSKNWAYEIGLKDIQYRIVLPDGTVRHVHDLGKVTRDPEGNVIMLSGTLQDVTDRVKAEQDLIEAREEAENANRAKSQFLSGMSHELRTPMNAIVGFGQLLKMETEQPLNDSQKENVDEIIKASHHLLELINDVLDLAKVESGRIDLSLEAITYAEVINETRQLIMPLAQNRGITLNVTHNNHDVTFEQLLEKQDTLRADRIRLKQVLLNLLSNAVKYNRENGQITIACNRGTDNKTRITITDTGKGLTGSQQAQLFKPFSRLQEENSDIEGTGIGLVITKDLIELMGGTIGLDSTPGVGSSFWIELPNDTQPGSQRTMPPARDTKTILAKLDCDYTILYIEDNPANLRLMTQMLDHLPKINLLNARDPLLGLELAAQHKPDLIILDINLPGMNGFDVFKLLRNRKDTVDTPVIALSANAMPGDIKKGFKAGFDDYITKPIEVQGLLKAIGTILQNRN
ncbi:MAG: hypothetical protein COB54_07990 [Alphaproteobacteria bacterium]|nr:MAG: hypothetical protein COB54_07990 [Alphaproteobacteria bacterium]